MKSATVFDIQRASFVDGPGIRTTVFFKGCNLRCAWCHNPESQSPKREMLLYRDKCTGCGKCREKCPNALASCELCGKCTLYCPQDAREICGEQYTTEQLLTQLGKDKAFYESSGGGITLSGGECMLQIDALEELLCACKKEALHTAVDTAGYVPFSYFERILPYTDLFLYDIKCFDSEKHREYTGVPNEKILENLAQLCRRGANIIVRIPIIPTFNDTAQEMKSIKGFLDACGFDGDVELLPYHALGNHKYSALGKEYFTFSVPSKETMQMLKEIFSK